MSDAPSGAAAAPARPARRELPVAGAVLATVLLAVADRYGYHRDELYFLRAGTQPAWGYADQPPLTPLLAHALDVAFGGWLVGLRLPSALIAALVVLLTGTIAHELGAGRGAQLLAASCMGVSAFLLAVGHLLSTSTIDLLVWTALCWLIVRALRDGGRIWLAVGAVAGIGLQNKWLPAFLLVALLHSGPGRRRCRGLGGRSPHNRLAEMRFPSGPRQTQRQPRSARRALTPAEDASRIAFLCSWPSASPRPRGRLRFAASVQEPGPPAPAAADGGPGERCRRPPGHGVKCCGRATSWASFSAVRSPCSATSTAPWRPSSAASSCSAAARISATLWGSRMSRTPVTSGHSHTPLLGHDHRRVATAPI